MNWIIKHKKIWDILFSIACLGFSAVSFYQSDFTEGIAWVFVFLYVQRANAFENDLNK